jgi:hypothetical protein
MRKQIKKHTQADKRREITEILRVSPDLSSRKIAELVGVSPKHPYLKKHPDILVGLSDRSLRAIKSPGVLDKMQEIGSRSPRYAQRMLYKERKQANKSPLLTVTEEDVEVFVSDIRTGLPQIKDCSVDVVFVDPPYGVKAVEELYSHISAVAGRILKEGGSLLVMTGGAGLNVAIRELGTDIRLRYNWDIAYVCRRGTPLIHTRKVTTAVKHVLWYVKGAYEGSIVYDLIEAPADEVQIKSITCGVRASMESKKYCDA